MNGDATGSRAAKKGAPVYPYRAATSHRDKWLIFRARAVEYSRHHGVRKTAAVFGRSERTIRRWRAT